MEDVRCRALLGLLDVKRGRGVRELLRETRGLDPASRIRHPRTLQICLSKLQHDGLVRREGGFQFQRGKRVLYFMTPNASRNVVKSTKPRIGELIILSSYDALRIGDDRGVFVYTEKPLREMTGKHLENVVEHVRESGQKIIRVIENSIQSRYERVQTRQARNRSLAEKKGSPDFAQKLSWSHEDDERYGFLERRLMGEIYRRNSRNINHEWKIARFRRRPSHFSRRVRVVAERLGKSPNMISDEDRLGPLKHDVLPLDDEILCDDEITQYYQLEKNRREYYDALEKIRNSVPPIAVLVCNRRFMDELAVDRESNLVQSSNSELILLDRLLRRLPGKTLLLAEKMFWEAAETRKYSKTLAVEDHNEEGPVGGQLIDGPHDQLNLGITLSHDLSHDAIKKYRFFKKVHRALRDEISRRGLESRLLDHNNAASVRELVEEENTRRGMKGIVKEEPNTVRLIYVYPGLKIPSL